MGCSYVGGDGMAGKLREMARGEGCFLSLLFHNVRSARGKRMELLRGRVEEVGIGLRCCLPRGNVFSCRVRRGGAEGVWGPLCIKEGKGGRGGCGAN